MEERLKLIEHFINKCSMAINEAEKVANMNEQLKSRMQCEVVSFKFKKVDGTIREARGTMIAKMLPPIKGNGRPIGFDLQLYFDVDKKSFRSFKKSNLIEL